MTTSDEHDLNKHDPLGEICCNLGWKIRSLYHINLKTTSGKIILGRDVVLNSEHIFNLLILCKHKQMILNADIKEEIFKRRYYDRWVGYTFLIGKYYHGKLIKKVKYLNDGSHNLEKFHENETVHILCTALNRYRENQH